MKWLTVLSGLSGTKRRIEWMKKTLLKKIISKVKRFRIILRESLVITLVISSRMITNIISN